MRQRNLHAPRRWRDYPAAIAFLLPSFLLFAVFNFYPMFEAIRLSFYKWDNPSLQPVFIGFANYLRLFDTPRFWNSLRVTLWYTLAVTAGSVGLGLLAAVALNHRWLILRSFWRVLCFLPTVTPTVAAAMVWMLLFNPSYGYVNTLLRQAHLQGPNWLSSSQWALPTLMTLGIWRRLGFTIVVYLAALQAIPQEYYESAQIDGAGAWQSLLRVTVPLIAPTTLMLVTLGLIDSFLVFDQVLVMTGGGPAESTEVIGVFLYRDAFTLFKMGTGAATAALTLVIISAITLLQWRFVGFGSLEEQT